MYAFTFSLLLAAATCFAAPPEKSRPKLNIGILVNGLGNPKAHALPPNFRIVDHYGRTETLSLDPKVDQFDEAAQIGGQVSDDSTVYLLNANGPQNLDDAVEYAAKRVDVVISKVYGPKKEQDFQALVKKVSDKGGTWVQEVPRTEVVVDEEENKMVLVPPAPDASRGVLETSSWLRRKAFDNYNANLERAAKAIKQGNPVTFARDYGEGLVKLMIQYRNLTPAYFERLARREGWQIYHVAIQKLPEGLKVVYPHREKKSVPKFYFHVEGLGRDRAMAYLDAEKKSFDQNLQDLEETGFLAPKSDEDLKNLQESGVVRPN